MSAVLPSWFLQRHSGWRRLRARPVSSAAAANAAAASFAALTASLDYLESPVWSRYAWPTASVDEAHLGRCGSGEPYITHPIAVAAQCATWKLDAQALMAALLHDVMEDCGVTKAELIDRFGALVAELVDGANKLISRSSSTREEIRPNRSARCRRPRAEPGRSWSS